MDRHSGSWIRTISGDKRNRVLGIGLLTVFVVAGMLTSQVWAAPADFFDPPGLQAAPVAVDDDYATPVNVTLNVAADGVLTNDSDPDDDPMTAVLGTDVTHGTLTLNADGSFEYIPTADYHGLDSFTYTVSAGGDTSGAATVTIAVNSAPVAVDDTETIAEDSGLNTFDVLADDTDIDGDTKTVTGVTQGTLGAAAIGTGGENVTYTPDADANGEDTFSYTISDGNGGTDTATVTVTITPVNDAPDAVDDTATIAEDSGINTIDVLANDTDVDGDQVVVTAVTQGPTGTAAISAGGGSVTFTPPANYHGGANFSYTISDGGTVTDTATVSVTVTPVNDAPDAVDDTATIAEDSGLNTFDVLANDTDIDGDTLTVTVVTQGTLGAVAIGTGGENVTYTPDANANGEDTFTYTISDGNGGTDTATVTVTITPVNDAPVLGTIGNKTVNELVELEFTATATDQDLPAPTLTYSLVGAPGGAEINTATGAFSWTPTEEQGPSPTVDDYTFDVCVTDGTASDCETIKVTVNEVNIAPTLGTIGDQTVDELAELTFTATATDADLPANDLTYSLVGAPATAAINANTGAFSWTPTEEEGPDDYTFNVCVYDGAATVCESITVTVNEVNLAPVLGAIGDKNVDEETLLTFTAAATDADLPANSFAYNLSPGTAGAVPAGTGIVTGSGVFTWTPTEAQGPGTYTFDVCVSDGTVSDCETITVTVNDVNVNPVAATDNVTVTEDSLSNIINVLANDSDDDIPANTLSVTGVNNAQNGLVGLGPGGDVRYTPEANYFGPDSFSYTISDGKGGTGIGTVNITVTAVNDAPVANSQSFSIAEDTSKAVTLTGSDIEASPLTYSIVTQPAHGTLSGTPPNVTYQPAANYNGADSFSFRVFDGAAYSSPAAVNITVTPVPDNPVGVADAYSINSYSDDPFVVTIAAGVLANDTDADGNTLSAVKVSDPTKGTLTLNANGSFSYDRTSAETTYTDTFTYRAKDNTERVSPDVTVTLRVDLVPPPVAQWSAPVAQSGGEYSGSNETVELKVFVNSIADVARVEFWFYDHISDNKRYVFIAADSTPQLVSGKYYFSTMLDMTLLPVGDEIQVFARTYDTVGNMTYQGDVGGVNYIARLFFERLNDYQVYLPLIKR